MEEAVNELTLWQKLPRLKFEGAIWPPTEGAPSEWRQTPTISDMGRAHHTGVHPRVVLGGGEHRVLNVPGVDRRAHVFAVHGALVCG